MINKVSKLLFIGAFLPLSACNYLTGENGMFRDRGNSYTDAQVLPHMVIPGDLDSYTIDQLYVVPENMATTSVVFEEIPLPKPIETGRREGVIIQNLGDRRWIVLDATPGQVWPLVRDYWTQLQVILDYENPTLGIMETSWLEVDSDPETRHKYRVSTEPGLHSGYSEIYVLHMESPRSEPIPPMIVWPAASNSELREAQILNTISQYLADRNDVYQASTSSLLAGSLEAERKANIIENEVGDQVLELRVDYNRAWVQIRQALVAAEIPITDSDRDEAVFNVKFAGIIEEVEEEGFIGRIFGGDDEPVVAEEKEFNVRLVDTGAAVNVITEAGETAEVSDELLEELLLVITNNLS